MRINNNIPALNTHRLLNKNTNKLQGALERLSSGKRINKASDDAAGMAISKKMEAQIRGLRQASRNSLDGISLIQTAEGALNEVHELLQRMRELSVQAANGTNEKEDKIAIQNEINELTKEVDRIANTTEFNNISLLNRNNISEEDLEIITSNLKKWWLVEAENLVKEEYGISASGVDMEITFTNNPNDNTSAFVRAHYDGINGEFSGKSSNLILNINLAHAQPIEATNIDGGSAPQYVDRIIAHEMVHAVMANTMNFRSMPLWFKEGTAEFIHGGDERLVGDIHKEAGGLDGDKKDKGIQSIVGKIDNISGASGSITPTEYSTSYIAVRYLDKQMRDDGHQDGIKSLMTYLAENKDSSLDDGIKAMDIGISNEKNLVNSMKSNIKNYEDLENFTGIQLDFEMDENGYAIEKDTGSIKGSSILGNNDISAEDILPQDDEREEEEQPLEGFNLTWSDVVSQEAINIQIGSNKGQQMALEITNMGAEALNIIDNGEGLNVVDEGRAEEAITRFNDAIEYVSAERSKLGSYQNRLEHTIRNLDNTAENLQEAESRIADLDMALEMSEFTKLNILQQAGTAMLAKSNDLPQSVLQLLG